jgi:hypothetical protein
LGQSFVGNLWRHGGAFAEFAAILEYRLEGKPADITFEEASHHPLGQSAEFWSSSRAADELRPAQPCLGSRGEGSRLPTSRMRQVDLREDGLWEFRRRVWVAMKR